jgi:hypothetical protein
MVMMATPSAAVVGVVYAMAAATAATMVAAATKTMVATAMAEDH